MDEPPTPKPSIAMKWSVQMPEPIAVEPTSNQLRRDLPLVSSARTVHRNPIAAAIVMTR
jgi:hypothetical protein